ncbi:unnamed protein product [Schistosoma curassoni]|uniref:Vps16_N domain-containing protein n=1 Tax=Schistosoma curassoni TaxID=6186 RepID=A0A183K5W7_9TREM|nr:unnamed protein product [Schistosoma curassoni]
MYLQREFDVEKDIALLSVSVEHGLAVSLSLAKVCLDNQHMYLKQLVPLINFDNDIRRRRLSELCDENENNYLLVL